MLDVESFATNLTECYQRCWLIAAAVTGDRAEADDIVQEAAMIALRKRAEFTAGTNFAAWIAQIVRLTALNHVKKTERRHLVVADPKWMDGEAKTISRSSQNGAAAVTVDGHLLDHQTEFDDRVLKALSQVSDVARACLLLRIVHQLPYHEIASTLQIPESTAMSHVHRAKESIRRQLAVGNQQSNQSPEHRGRQ